MKPNYNKNPQPLWSMCHSCLTSWTSVFLWRPGLFPRVFYHPSFHLFSPLPDLYKIGSSKMKSLFLFSFPLILLWVISTPIPSVCGRPPHLHLQSRLLFWTHTWAEKNTPITLIIYLCFSPECLKRTLYITHLPLCLLFVSHNKIRGMQALCF